MMIMKKLLTRSLVLSGLALSGLAMGSAQAGELDVGSFKDQYLGGTLSWEEVEARAKEEGTVNWFHWGGSESLNGWIERAVVPKMKAKGITLKTTRIGGTREAVDLVLTEKQAGRKLGEGSVDMIWLNGDNFYTLAVQDALFGSFADKVPNAQNFEFSVGDPRAQLNLSDFGTPTKAREMPWSGEQYVCYFDTARLPRAKAPADFADLEQWLTKTPGRFTYVKPPHYIGNTFVQTVLYAFNPTGKGFSDFQNPRSSFTPAEFAKLTKPGFEYLKRIEPLLLGGENPIYPQNQGANQALFNNGEVDMGCEFGLYIVDAKKKTGAFSETTETLAFPKNGMIKNKNFLAIPANAPHPAAALVLANVMSTVELQISKLKDIGYPLGIDTWKLSEQNRMAAMKAAPSHHGVSAEVLSNAAVADTNASLVKVIERIWAEYIERKSKSSFEDIVAKAMKAG